MHLRAHSRLDPAPQPFYNLACGGATRCPTRPMETDPFLLNAAKPVGSDGEAILLRMNNSHAGLAAWGFSHLNPAPDACNLYFGCGGGANLAALLELFQL